MKIELARTLRLFNHFMAVIYVVAGAFLIFSDSSFLSMGNTYKIILGAMLLLYGFYRIYRATMLYRTQNEN